MRKLVEKVSLVKMIGGATAAALIWAYATFATVRYVDAKFDGAMTDVIRSHLVILCEIKKLKSPRLECMTWPYQPGGK
jgi:hypothetical protein